MSCQRQAPPTGALRLGLALLVAGVASARADEWEWRAAAGAQIDSSSHGVVDLGARKGPLSIQLLTDTLDVRYAPESAAGKWWLGARGEALVAGIMLAPWSDGAPDPARGRYASYSGVDAGWARYLPRSLYVGLAASARLYIYGATSETRIALPGPTTLLTAETFIGRYTPELHVSARAGADLYGGTLSPHVAAELIYRPQMALAPRLELRVGWARDQAEVARTRVGGENPYVVPLAGAGWGEWWAERYAASRIGFSWRGSFLELGAVVDAAALDQGIVTGVAALGRGWWRRWFAEASLGYAPWIQRGPGVSRVSGWLLVGAEWGRGR